MELNSALANHVNYNEHPSNFEKLKIERKEFSEMIKVQNCNNSLT